MCLVVAGLLTDNWYSGYRGEGAMEVGLTYLAGENPGLLVSSAALFLTPADQ